MKVAIRLRLTLLYFSFFALVGVLLSLASWLLLERSLTALMLHELDERIDEIQAFLTGRPADTDTRRAELLREYRLKDEGKWLQITDDRGVWLYFSDRASVADSFPPFPIAPGNLRPFVPPRGHLLHALTRDLAVRGRFYYVSMAISADRSAAILAQFRRDLWLLMPLGFISAAAAGWRPQLYKPARVGRIGRSSP